MVYDFLTESSPIPEEIMDEYATLRMRGYSRESSIAQIREKYEAELNDEDDRPLVLVAVALALSRKKELTPQTRDDALQSIELLREQESDCGMAYVPRDLDAPTRYLSADRVGPEATHRVKKTYDPGWNIGDTFIHAFSQPEGEKTGLLGWYIVIRKVGEYLDNKSRHMQLAYLTICPADAIPQTDAELQALGCLRMMEHDNGWDYLCQFSFSNKKDEERWQLQKIGCFPNAGCPDDATVEDPRVSMPLFGILRRNSSVLSYEDDVCWWVKSHGIHKNR